MLPLAKGHCIYRLYNLHSCSTLRKRNGHGLAHIRTPSSSLCTNYTLAMEQYIKQVAHYEGIHIHSYSFSPKTCFIHHKHISSAIHLQPSSNLPTSTHTRAHACTDARKHIHMVLAQAHPTMSCIRLILYRIEECT